MGFPCGQLFFWSQWQLEQEPLEQELHPEPEDPAKGFSTPLIPKTESFLSTFGELHLGHSTLVEEKTSFSNSCAHWAHLYSKMGILYYTTKPVLTFRSPPLPAWP